TKQRVGNCQHLVSRLSGSWGKEWTVAHYTLNVVVEGLDLDDSTQNQFLAELSYVAAPSRIAGVDSVEIEIEAETPIDAWSQISVDLKQIQVIVKRIDLDLVNANEIALRLDVNRETVRLWGKGERRAGFPPSFANTAGTLLWRWADVYAWALGDSKLSKILALTPLPADVVDSLNGSLAQVRASRRD
ncbi:MAG: hypothetical protein ACTII7_13215, partial [Galactobacter sp.]